MFAHLNINFPRGVGIQYFQKIQVAIHWPQISILEWWLVKIIISGIYALKLGNTLNSTSWCLAVSRTAILHAKAMSSVCNIIVKMLRLYWTLPLSVTFSVLRIFENYMKYLDLNWQTYVCFFGIRYRCQFVWYFIP